MHMLYVSIDRTVPIDSDEEFREFLELDIMLWDVIHKATQEDETMLKIMDHIMRGRLRIIIGRIP